MSNIPNSLNDDVLQGDDSQDPADHFLLRDGEVEEDDDLRTIEEHDQDDGPEDNMTDVEADADTLASAGDR